MKINSQREAEIDFAVNNSTKSMEFEGFEVNENDKKTLKQYLSKEITEKECIEQLLQDNK